MESVCEKQQLINCSWDNKERKWKKRKRPLAEDYENAKMFVRVFTVSAKKPELLAIRYC